MKTSVMILILIHVYFGVAATTLSVPNTFVASNPAVAAEVNANFTAVKNAVDDNDTRLAALEGMVTQLQTDLMAANAKIALIENNSVLTLNGLLTKSMINGYATAEFTGVNIQINNGTGTTGNGVNGLGNLTIGYNEPRPNNTALFFCSKGQYLVEADCSANGGIWDANVRRGSHNLIVGQANSYDDFGGIVAGGNNAINSPYANVLGGIANTASGFQSVISGGQDNTTIGSNSSINGGRFNQTEASTSSINGGEHNTTTGTSSAINGGQSVTISSSKGTDTDILDTRLTAVESNSVLALDGLLSKSTINGYDTALFEAVNIQVISGSGDTSGVTNGLGNVIVGYNESFSSAMEFCSFFSIKNSVDCIANGGVWDRNIKIGSHNLVIGEGNSYTSYSGIVSGAGSILTGTNAAVIAGDYSISAGYASTAMGESNVATGDYSVVFGLDNVASGDYSFSTGDSNVSSGDYSVAMGRNNMATSTNAVITGGNTVTISTNNGTNIDPLVVSIANNDARLTAVEANTVLELDGFLMLSSINGYDTAEFTGVNLQINNGTNSTGGIVNGLGNLTIGYNETNTFAPEFCSDPTYTSSAACIVAGLSLWGNNVRRGSHNLILGRGNSYDDYAGFVGGSDNTINNAFASIFSGALNYATGGESVIVGGLRNQTSGSLTVVSGGQKNKANASYSVVTGGSNNTADGPNSVVSGGSLRTAAGDKDWVAGSLFEDF